jgi:hypothetical protein
MPPPSVGAVDEIRRISDPILRNLRITQCYHELSAAITGWTGQSANWCSFATWASKQAGQSIRKEDLQRAFERLFRRSPEVLSVIGPLLREVGRLGVPRARTESIETVLRALDPATAIERASDAIARGNLKVFEEIAHEFARFIAEFGDDTRFDAARTERFCAALRDGEPPDGQARLRQAFSAYCDARFTNTEREKAELLFFANLLVGYHEQNRLQPEILEAMNAGFGDADAVKRRLLAALLPGYWVRMRVRIAWLLGRELPLDRLLDSLVELARRQIREVITRSLMSLRISSGEVLRLGRDLRADYPPTLRQIKNTGLLELLATVDRTADSRTGIGARDWSNFDERIHFIADLFRAYHASPLLHDPPFDPDQVGLLRSGHLPPGRL